MSRTIENLFPNGVVESYTPHGLQATWPKTGKTLGYSGYWVAKSSLTPLSSPSSNPLNLWKKHGSGAREVSVQKRAFDAELILGWSVKQKRAENSRANLKHPIC